ncbi:FAD-binding domain-containing protein [Nitrosomonas sp. Nm33]
MTRCCLFSGLAPCFRIFNPTTQIKKFDKNFEYIQIWVKRFA